MSPPTASTGSNEKQGSRSPFSSLLTEDALLLQIAKFLPARDLLSFQCLSRKYAALPTDELVWKGLCEKRWKNWKRYHCYLSAYVDRDDHRLLVEHIYKHKKYPTWQQRYIMVEHDATRISLRQRDLGVRTWHIIFYAMAEGRHSEAHRIRFVPHLNRVIVPGYPVMPFNFVDASPPTPPSDSIRRKLAMFCQTDDGDQPNGATPTISTTQWLNINDFPTHYIARHPVNATWIILNDNVVMFSD